jgi:outer membrane protein W
VDYEHHELKGAKAGISVVSVSLFIAFGTRYDRMRPYSTFGVGMNFTASNNEPGGANVDAKNSLALRVRICADWFLTNRVALNVETAWKLNNPDIESDVSMKGFAPGV